MKFMRTTNRISCVICRKELSTLGLAGHINIIHNGNTSFQLAGNKVRRGNSSWCAGLTKDTDSRVFEIGRKVSKTLTGREGFKHTNESKQKISDGAKVNGNTGGYRQNSGRGKKGWYRGIWCSSSWELAFLIYNLDHNIPIKRCKEVRKYELDGKIKRYYPDFEVEGIIVEIKGFNTKQWEAKHIGNPDVKVLFETDMEPYLQYVKTHYGDDFIKLLTENAEVGSSNALEKRGTER